MELNLQLPFSWIQRIWKFQGFRERERESERERVQSIQYLRISADTWLYNIQHCACLVCVILVKHNLIAGGRGGTGSFGHLLLFKVCHRAHFLNTCDKLKKAFCDDKPEDVFMCCWSGTPITAIDNSTAIKLNTQYEMHKHWSIFGITNTVSWKEQNKRGNFCHVLLWAAHGIIHDLISNLRITGSYMTISKVGGGAWRTSSTRISKVVYVNYQSSGVVVTVITKLLLLLLLTWEEEIKHKWHHGQTHSGTATN